MNRKSVIVLGLLLLMSFAISSCNLGPLSISFGPTSTPIPTPTPTSTSTPIPTPTPTSTSTPIPTPTPVVVLGITTPIEVKGASLLFYKIETMESFEHGTKISEPTAPYDLLIAIKATTTHSNTNYPCEWRDNDKVRLEYLKDGKKVDLAWGICESNTGGWVRFFFATYKEGASDYIIVLPGGGRVPLDGLIDETTGKTL